MVCYTQDMNDAKILSKAKRRVITHLVFFYILICAFLFATYYALNLQIFQASTFSYTFLGIALGEALIFLIAFLLLSTGNKWMRWIYWIAFILNLGFFYIPLKALWNDLAHFLTYGICIFLMIIFNMILIQIGLYFYRNPYCRIFYDHIVSSEIEQKMIVQEQSERPLVIEEKEIVEETIPEPTKAEKQYIKDDEEIETEKEPYTFPQMALRLGICVYGELMVFPIITQIFSNWFASYDLQHVFATREMFIFSIFTAFIWTIPILYLYYNQPQSKKIVIGCLVAEGLFLLYSIYSLMGYYKSQEYPTRAFVFFGILELIRYGILLYFVREVFQSKHEKIKLQL